MTTELLLPTASDAGRVRRWFLPVNDANSQVELEYYRPYARFLGLGSSHTPEHSDQPHPGGFVTRRLRCNACRWFEARIFRELVLPDGNDEDDELPPTTAELGAYVVHNAGMSIVPGEVPLYRYDTTPSPDSVVELMTTRRTTDDGSPRVFLAKPAASVLAAASVFDPQLRDAFRDRAVW